MSADSQHWAGHDDYGYDDGSSAGSNGQRRGAWRARSADNYGDGDGRRERRSSGRQVIDNLRQGDILEAIGSLPVPPRVEDRAPAGRRRRQDDGHGASSTDSRPRASSSSAGSRSRRRRTDARQMLGAAIAAGAVEALRVRHEGGAWKGEKGMRVASAALVAGALDGVIDEASGQTSKKHAAEAVIGSLLANQAAYGPSSSSRQRPGSWHI